MAFESNADITGVFTAADANIERFRFVQNTGYTVTHATAAAAVLGVCMLDNPQSGQAVPVQIRGIAMVEVGASALVANSDVEVGANGLAVVKSAGVSVAKALVAGATGAIVPVLLKTGY